MNRPSLIVWFRHAQSWRNKIKQKAVYLPDTLEAKQYQNVCDGDVGLTSLGTQQAVVSGPGFREKFGTFDVVYDSGYLRTQLTRNAVLSAYTEEERAAMEMRESYLIRERDSGYTHGMTQHEALKHFPFLQSYWKKEGHFYARPVGGESKADLCNRVNLFHEEIYRDWPGKKVLIFSHGGTILSARFLFERWTAKEYCLRVVENPPNCGVVAYAFQEEKNVYEAVCINKTFHNLFAESC